MAFFFDNAINFGSKMVFFVKIGSMNSIIIYISVRFMTILVYIYTLRTLQS